MILVEFLFYRLLPAFTLPLLGLLGLLRIYPELKPTPWECLCLTLLASLFRLIFRRRNSVSLALDASLLSAGLTALLAAWVNLYVYDHYENRHNPDEDIILDLADIESGRTSLPELGNIHFAGPIARLYSQTKSDGPQRFFYPIVSRHHAAYPGNHGSLQPFKVFMRAHSEDLGKPDELSEEIVGVHTDSSHILIETHVGQPLVAPHLPEIQLWAGLGAVTFSLGLLLFIPNVRRQWRERDPKPLPCDREP